LPLARELYVNYRLFGVDAVAMAVQDVINGRKPLIRMMGYRGFVLVYSLGTSDIGWVRFGRIWEPEVSERLAAELGTRRSPVFVDVGANIGLMTLNALADVPSTRVYAFEPGVDQEALLRRTVSANHLEDRVTPYRVAVGAHNGEAPFTIHGGGFSLYDGFFDTGRAGSPHSVVVPVQTLDRWWHSAGYPEVSVIKVDTEGAELWVLQGAGAVLEKCRPMLILEIQPMNLRCYPYDAYDVLRWLAERGYGVETLRGVPVTETDFDAFHREGEENFIARIRTR
jgi:FkbM family methyltransferase